MRPDTAFTLLIVVAFGLVMTPVTIWLHTGSVAGGTAWAFCLVAVAIVLIGLWMLRRSDVVRTVRPYSRMGSAMFLFVLGLLLIFAAITLSLMNVDTAEPLVIGLESEPIQLPSLPRLLPVAGVVLMLLGLWVNQSDKEFVRLRPR